MIRAFCPVCNWKEDFDTEQEARQARDSHVHDAAAINTDPKKASRDNEGINSSKDNDNIPGL